MPPSLLDKEVVMFEEVLTPSVPQNNFDQAEAEQAVGVLGIMLQHLQSPSIKKVLAAARTELARLSTAKKNDEL